MFDVREATKLRNTSLNREEAKYKRKLAKILCSTLSKMMDVKQDYEKAVDEMMKLTFLGNTNFLRATV